MASIDWPSDLADVLVSGYDIVEDGLDAWHSCNTWSCATEYPDGAYTYLQDAWATTDSWNVSDGTLDVSSTPGALRYTHGATGPLIARNVGTLNARMVRLRIRASVSISVLFYYYNGSIWTSFASSSVGTSWVVIDGYLASGSSNNSLYIGGGGAAWVLNEWFEIDWIYIGTGICTNLLTDDSGNGIDCYVYGDTSVAGVSGNGLYRNGVNAYERSVNVLATVPDIWHYHEVMPNGNAQLSTPQLFCNYKPTSTSGGFFYISREASHDDLYVWYCNSATNTNVSVNSFFTGYSATSITIDVMINWITGVVNVYRNGVYFGTGTMTTPVKPTAGSYIYFGSYQGTSYFAKGTYDERRLYSYARTAPEIAYLYANPTTYEAIPELPLQNGYYDSKESGVLRTSIDSGLVVQRRRYQAVSRNIKAAFPLDNNQKQVFDQFYETTLMDGTLEFNWTDPTTGVVYDTRFTSTPVYSGTSNNWKVACELEVLP
jgi:hypothetical protein